METHWHWISMYFPSLRIHNCSERNPEKDIFRNNGGRIERRKKAGSKACWDDSHMAVPDWECLLEASVVADLPGHVGPGGGGCHVDAGGGVGACACTKRKQWLKGHISHWEALQCHDAVINFACQTNSLWADPSDVKQQPTQRNFRLQ